MEEEVGGNKRKIRKNNFLQGIIEKKEERSPQHKTKTECLTGL